MAKTPNVTHNTTNPRHSGMFLAGIQLLNMWIPAKNMPGWRTHCWCSLK